MSGEQKVDIPRRWKRSDALHFMEREGAGGGVEADRVKLSGVEVHLKALLIQLLSAAAPTWSRSDSVAVREEISLDLVQDCPVCVSLLFRFFVTCLVVRTNSPSTLTTAKEGNKTTRHSVHSTIEVAIQETSHLSPRPVDSARSESAVEGLQYKKKGPDHWLAQTIPCLKELHLCLKRG
nr:uncharacterized protein LOC112281379 isoform X3 [Physcomitrium patens]|eukprot:XP_024373580.1 uncharacterized protein LOC112281379 isoform X3 [Physcomitrella patens]